MPTPLLTTKLYIPPLRPGMVSRPRLIERLNAGLLSRRKLTLISAPAGFGKTTLLSEWAAGCERPVAWLSLDEGDNDPTRFWAYVIAALQTVREGIGGTALAALQSPQPPPVEAILTTLINEIAAVSQGDHEGCPYVLVLDDYHAINAQPIHDGLAFLLDHLPPQMHLGLTTRSDPPLHLTRLRGRGQLTELRPTDLRFTPDEVTEFLNQVMGLELSADNVAALASRTEGWIAGLQMAAVSMQGREDIASFVRAFTGSNRFILDYLVEEVLDQQPSATQEFLLKTSILERLTGTLCDAVTGISERINADGRKNRDSPSQVILERLERANLFIVPLDDERRWYRYHHLFGSVLRLHLKQKIGTLGLLPLHRRACDWYARHDLNVEALHHAIAGQDFDRAADLIKPIAVITTIQGGATTVRGWINALPDDLVRERPHLCVLHAWAFNLTEQVEAIEPRLQDAERALQAQDLPDDDPLASDLRGQIAVIRASNARRQNDLSLSTQLLEESLDLLAQDNLIVRTTVSLNLGRAYMFSGKLNAAVDAFRRAQSLGQASGNVLTSLNAAGFLAAILIAQGQLRRAAGLCRQTIDHHLEHHRRPLPTLGHVYASLGRVLYEWNDLNAAAAHLEQGIAPGVGDQTYYGYRSTVRLGASMLAWIRQIQGARGGAVTLSRQVVAIAEQEQRNLYDADFSAWRVRLWLAQDNVAVAEAWAEAYRAGEALPRIWRPYGDLALARVLIAQQRLEEALDMLTPIRQSAQETGGVGWVIEALILEALIFQATGDTDRASTSLAQALSLAEPEDYVRTFVDEGPAMAELLRHAASRGIAPKYVSKLLAALDVSEYGSMGEGLPHAHTQPLIEPLSERELEVLRLLTSHLSSTEMAQELFIAKSTVRSHIKSIYSKLNVHKRKDAIQRAKELKLF